MKQILRNVRRWILERQPNRVLLCIENRVKNPDLRGYIQQIRLNKFVCKTDFSKLEVSTMPVCSIQKGQWDYPLFQMCFLNNMIGLCVYCLSCGYRPRVDYANSQGKKLWDQFLMQPFSSEAVDSERKPDCILDIDGASFVLPWFPNEADIDRYYSVFSSIAVWNEQTMQYFQHDYKTVIPKNSRVIGVLCRGTDYTATKPKYHPIQPEVGEVIDLVKEKMREYHCDYVYLATEERHIADQFEAVFPGQVLENKRQYFDSFYELYQKEGKQARIGSVHFERQDDAYYKSLEYLSSIYILSKCNLFIGGSAGGSRIAIVLNHNQYEYSYLFNKGFY